MRPSSSVSPRRSTPQPPPPLRRTGPRWPLRPVLFALAIAGAFVGVAAALLLVSTDDPAVAEDEIERLLSDAPSGQADLPSYFYDVTSRPASLALSSSPPGALATLNAEALGPTPLTLDALRPGYYAIALRHPDFEGLDTTLYLASGAHYDLVLELGARPTPPPVQGAAPGGQLRAARPRARPAPTPVESGGRFERADPQTMQRVWHTGSLSVVSRPAGARVAVDGQARGQTPLTLGGLRPGTYTVTVSLRGYGTEEHAVQVSAGGVSHLRVQLAR